jgi:3,4-dihydroxy 2-butanone 4-phosphate synthase/GTP cyclohydrolase II
MASAVDAPWLDLDSIESALEALSQGECVIIPQSLDPGDWVGLYLAAEQVDVPRLKQLLADGPGAFYLCLTADRCEQLGLTPIAAQSEIAWRSSLTVSLAHRDFPEGSLDSLANTIKRAADPSVAAEEFTVPGLVNPLRALRGGVLERAAPMEAAVDLARLAGLQPAALVAALANEDSSIATVRDLPSHPARQDRKIVTIDSIVRYRLRTEMLVERHATVGLPTTYGTFALAAFVDRRTGGNHIAMVKGELAGGHDPLVYVHPECFAANVLRSTSCDCGRSLEQALAAIEAEGAGAVIYLMREQRCATTCVRTIDGPVTGREETEGAITSQILAQLGLTGVRLLVGTAQRPPVIGGFGLEVLEHVPLRLNKTGV